MTQNRESGLQGKNVKSHVKPLGFDAFQAGGLAASVDVEDDKIIRITPLHYDRHYNNILHTTLRSGF